MLKSIQSKIFYRAQWSLWSLLLTYEQSSINIWIFPKELLADINGWVIMILHTKEHFILVKEHIVHKSAS